MKYLPKITRFKIGALSALGGLALCIYGGSKIGKVSWAWSDYLANRVDQIAEMRSIESPPNSESKTLERGIIYTGTGLGLLAFGLVLGSARQETEYKTRRSRIDRGKSYSQLEKKERDPFDHTRRDFNDFFK